MSAHLLRPIASSLLLGAAYFAAAALVILIGRFDDGVAFVWIATAMLVARLSAMPQRRWWGPVVACFLGSALATGLFGFGWALAVPLALLNVAEAICGAWALRRLTGAFDPMKSLAWVAGFLVALGICGPAVGAAGAAIVVPALAHQDPIVTGVRWYLGHALGTIAFAPVLMLVLQSTPAEWIGSVRRGRTLELVGLLALVIATTLAVFGQSELPLLFVPILPMILATFRTGRLGAAASIVAVAVIGGTMTLMGTGPLNLVAGPMGMHLQVLQFYLAATVMTILPIAAELNARDQLFRQLRESEARYRLVTDNSTDIVLNLDVEGIIRFASPSIRQMGGYAPEEVVGTPALRLVEASDREAVRAVHLQTLAEPDRTFIVEYRAIPATGPLRWYESHTRAVLNEDNVAVGVVSAVRDIAHRKAVEGELTAAAFTDPLTNLANRRAFFAEFDRRIAIGGAGHIAMLDLDHFKQINDAHGHAAGDEVLKRFAGVARGCLRDADLLARIGGEEFAVLLPGATLAHAALVCDRIRAATRAAPVSVGEMTLLVTVSGGVAPYAPGASAAAVLRAADVALYQAKSEGRDRLALVS